MLDANVNINVNVNVNVNINVNVNVNVKDPIRELFTLYFYMVYFSKITKKWVFKLILEILEMLKVI